MSDLGDLALLSLTQSRRVCLWDLQLHHWDEKGTQPLAAMSLSSGHSVGRAQGQPRAAPMLREGWAQTPRSASLCHRAWGHRVWKELLAACTWGRWGEMERTAALWEAESFARMGQPFLFPQSKELAPLPPRAQPKGKQTSGPTSGSLLSGSTGSTGVPPAAHPRAKPSSRTLRKGSPRVPHGEQRRSPAQPAQPGTTSPGPPRARRGGLSAPGTYTRPGALRQRGALSPPPPLAPRTQDRTTPQRSPPAPRSPSHRQDPLGTPPPLTHRRLSGRCPRRPHGRPLPAARPAALQLPLAVQGPESHVGQEDEGGQRQPHRLQQALLLPPHRSRRRREEGRKTERGAALTERNLLSARDGGGRQLEHFRSVPRRGRGRRGHAHPPGGGGPSSSPAPPGSARGDGAGSGALIAAERLRN